MPSRVLVCQSARKVEPRNPSHEAALEFLRIERGKNIAEVVMRGRSMAKRPEPAQQIELLLAKAGDVDECLRPGQHGEQTQEQHLGKRIEHLAGLPSVRKILEIVQKNNGFADRPKIRRRLHRVLRKS